MCLATVTHNLKSIQNLYNLDENIRHFCKFYAHLTGKFSVPNGKAKSAINMISTLTLKAWGLTLSEDVRFRRLQTVSTLEVFTKL